MRRENRSGRPGGDRPRATGGGRRAAGGRNENRTQSSGRRPVRSERGRDQEGSYPDRREAGTGRFSGERGTLRLRTKTERDGTSAAGRFGAPGSDRFRTKSTGRARVSKSDSDNSKKLVLRKEKRLSKGQLLKELGYSAGQNPFREQAPRKTAGKTSEVSSDLIRLNRFISNAGICSRREADTFITAGVVTINGQVVTELGTKVSPSDEVRFDGRLITPERKVYMLLNKPKDFVTTTDDPHATQTVMDLVRNACPERIYPVGRLDRNTTGLLLLTNDGDLAKKLSHPSHQVAKVYQVTLDKNVSVNDIQKIADGIELEDGVIAADAISFVEGQQKNTIGIEIHSGRYRIVRRIFESLGYKVKALDRVAYAGLTKKNLPRGKWRFLAPPEVNYLRMR
jgi:23S rRNA pseudouridine2605 synthase